MTSLAYFEKRAFCQILNYLPSEIKFHNMIMHINASYNSHLLKNLQKTKNCKKINIFTSTYGMLG
jgi:hypothetical protein